MGTIGISHYDVKVQSVFMVKWKIKLLKMGYGKGKASPVLIWKYIWYNNRIKAG
jgi:hypothetical protein